MSAPRLSKRPLEELLPLILATAGALGVTPFAIMRLMNREWLLGLIDVAIVSGLVALAYSVYRTGHIRLLSLAISAFCVGGMLLSVYVNGPQQFSWAFPAMLAVYFLLRPAEAVTINVVTIASLAVLTHGAVPTAEFATMLITLTVTSAFAFAFASITRSHRNRLLQLATQDPLTGAGNRRAMDEKLQEICVSPSTRGRTASLVILDLDNFKHVNDEYGHEVGDQILVGLTETVALRIRSTDTLYRIGGEEFVIITDGEGAGAAERLAEQLREIVQTSHFLPDRPVTISLGVAERGDGEDPKTWLRRADSALYAAKRAGRNTTTVAAPVAKRANAA